MKTATTLFTVVAICAGLSGVALSVNAARDTKAAAAATTAPPAAVKSVAKFNTDTLTKG
jgi:hypothetical protein